MMCSACSDAVPWASVAMDTYMLTNDSSLYSQGISLLCRHQLLSGHAIEAARPNRAHRHMAYEKVFWCSLYRKNDPHI